MQKEPFKLMLLVFVLLTRYATPSENKASSNTDPNRKENPNDSLFTLLLSWLNKIRGDKTVDRLVKMAINNLKTPCVHKESGRAYFDWPPSLYEIDAVYKDKSVDVQVMWPSGEHYSYSVNETTTVESLLKTKIFNESFFRKEPESAFYWLYTCEDDQNKFPKPLAREKKILKLMYKDEKM